MVPACSSGTLTNVLPHMNAMPDTGHDTPSHHSIQTQGRPVAVLCGTSHWNTQLPILMKSTATHLNEIFPRLSTHTSECPTL